MTIETSTSHHQAASDSSVPRSIARAMDGAQAFLHSALLKVPWLWRCDSTILDTKPKLSAEELRTYGKRARSQISVSSPLLYTNLVASSSNPDKPVHKRFQLCHLTISVCIDCGEGWHPRDVTREEEEQQSRIVCWANVALGVFLCSRCLPVCQF